MKGKASWFFHSMYYVLFDLNYLGWPDVKKHKVPHKVRWPPSQFLYVLEHSGIILLNHRLTRLTPLQNEKGQQNSLDQREDWLDRKTDIRTESWSLAIHPLASYPTYLFLEWPPGAGPKVSLVKSRWATLRLMFHFKGTKVVLNIRGGVTNPVIYSLTLRTANPDLAQKKFYDGKDCSRSAIRKSRALSHSRL